MIVGIEPMREGELPFSYKVGVDGVTDIKYSCMNYGDHGVGQFDVYKGDEIYASMMHRATADVFYFTSED